MARTKSDREAILKAVEKIVKQYDTRLTLRQIHYRLVSLPAGTVNYKNTLGDYKYLSKVLVAARKSGRIAYSAIEDRTRGITARDSVYYETPSEEARYRVDRLRELLTRPPRVSLPEGLYQQDVCVIALEKQALEAIFRGAIGRNCVLVVCRGYNSLTQIHLLAEHVKADTLGRRFHLRFFSDFDPTGLDIQRNFVQQTEELGVRWASVRRVALTEQQVEEYDLPYAPVKATDARAGNWSAAGVVELDSLDPHVLQGLVEDCREELWDRDLEREVRRLEEVLNRRARREYRKLRDELIRELLG